MKKQTVYVICQWVLVLISLFAGWAAFRRAPQCDLHWIFISVQSLLFAILAAINGRPR